jgi:hypothetical protein
MMMNTDDTGRLLKYDVCLSYLNAVVVVQVPFPAARRLGAASFSSTCWGTLESLTTSGVTARAATLNQEIILRAFWKADNYANLTREEIT